MFGWHNRQRQLENRLQGAQQMVNQLQLERDSLSQELRRSRASKGRPWCGDGPPDVSAIHPMPGHFQRHEERLNLRNCELRDALEFGSPDVIARLSHLLSQGASQLASLRQGTGCDGSSPSDTDVCFDRCRGCQTQMSGWWALMSSGTLIRRLCDNDLCRLKDSATSHGQ